MTERTDEELLAAGGRGDRGAFGELVERHHRGVVHFVYRFLGGVDRDAAEDLAQEVFLRAWQGARSFKPRAKVRTWLFRVAKNACLNYWRGERLRRAAPLTNDESSPETSPQLETGEDRALAEEKAARVRQVVGELPANQRAAIVLRHFHDLAYADIAEVLELSVAAVESLLFRARQTLRGKLTATKTTGPPQVLSEMGVEPS